jgi:hypothetical protein
LKDRSGRLSPRPPSNGDGATKALTARMSRIEHELDLIKRAWEVMGTSRQGVRDQIEKDRAALDVQFIRIADLQAEVDRLKATEIALQSEVQRLRTQTSIRSQHNRESRTPTV